MTQDNSDKPTLLSGGNPQIAKGYGEAPVQAWIAAAPDWKSAAAARLDALITRTVPGVSKAVKWNSPLYGSGPKDGEPQTWFLGVHVYARYLKIAFFNGADLAPQPPVASKQARVRYLHIHEGEAVDEARLADWIRQAAALPGEKM